MKAYLQLTLSQLRLFGRNRQVLFWTLMFPVFFMVMLGSFLGGGQSVELTGVLVDEDGTAEASALSTALLDSAVLQLETGIAADEALARLRNGDTQFVIVLPSGIGAELGTAGTGAGESVVGEAETGTRLGATESFAAAGQVMLYLDETNQIVSELVQTTVSAHIDALSKQITGYEPVVTVASVGVQSLQLRYIDFLVPGIVAMMIMSNNLNGVAGQISSWRERGILRRMQSTPLRSGSFIAAQITARLVLNGLQATIVVLIGHLVFGTQVNGSWLLLLSLIVLGTLAFMSIGFIIAGIAKTPESAGPIAGFVSFPLLFLGGVFFPISNMPDFLQPIVKLLPIAHLSTAMRQVMNVGATLADVRYDVLLLCGWLVVAFFIATRTFRWE